MATTSPDSPFAFAPPEDASDPFPPPFSSLALLASDDPSSSSTRSASLLQLASTLLNLRIAAAYKKEMAALSGELRDEWRGRIAAVKGDWMARIIVGDEDEDNAEGGQEGEKVEIEGEAQTDVQEAPMIPTIISDHDGVHEMSSRVDKIVEKEFKDSMLEAEERLRGAVLKREKMEMEVFLATMASCNPIVFYLLSFLFS
ncbi:hypothetical protein P7C70_g8802, partial [Phenoliferia sp. Uapishka_3]